MIQIKEDQVRIVNPVIALPAPKTIVLEKENRTAYVLLAYLGRHLENHHTL